MRRVIRFFADAFRKGDKILLLLCLVTTIFGCLVIASTTNANGSFRYIFFQIICTVGGFFCYLIFSNIDAAYFAERRTHLVLFNTGLLLMLIPFGQTISGNRSWLNFPFLPFNIQPAEICKITYVLIMASVMASHQNKLSTPLSVGHMVLHLLLLFGLNYVISSDMGVSLIFVFIFIGMTFAGGVHWIWFASVIGIIIIGAPIAWEMMPDNYMKERIAVLFDPSLDAMGTGALYQTVRAQRSLTGGGLTGQGLFQGHRTQTPGALFAQHTDFIFAAIGEELGFLGCAFVLLLLFLIIARCIWVGVKSPDFMRRLICFGVAAALFFQVIVNIGMCIGVMPVIGLTLPFVSYGSSSLISLYIMLGLVSGVYARPTAPTKERYIRPPLEYYKG